jgi:hypothetical protein
MGTSTEVAGYFVQFFVFFFFSRRARVYLTCSLPPSAPLLRASLLRATALRSAILDREQDRLRLAGLSPQRGAQTQDGADVQVQSGTPFRSVRFTRTRTPFPFLSFLVFVPVVAIFCVLDFPQFARGVHAANYSLYIYIYISVRHRRPYMKTAVY